MPSQQNPHKRLVNGTVDLQRVLRTATCRKRREGEGKVEEGEGGKERGGRERDEGKRGREGGRERDEGKRGREGGRGMRGRKRIGGTGKGGVARKVMAHRGDKKTEQKLTEIIKILLSMSRYPHAVCGGRERSEVTLCSCHRP